MEDRAQALIEFYKDIEEFDKIFARWKTKNPGQNFTQFSTLRGVRNIESGMPHRTLGTNLTRDDDWWEHGKERFESILGQARVDETAKICEVGCGSLRVGAHFIKRQNPGCYFGLDVTSAYYKIGMELIGPLMDAKKPRFGVIENRLDAARNWAPDLVFTNSVTRHVAPEEEQEHFEMLRQLANKKGAKIVFDAHLSKEPLRFARSGWARTMDQFSELMWPFKLVQSTDSKPIRSKLFPVERKVLTFASPQTTG